MTKLTPKDLSDLPDNVSMSLILQDIDSLSIEEVGIFIKDSFRVLKNHGVVEFSVMDFGWLVRQYTENAGRITQELCDMLLATQKGSLWDEFAISKQLLTSGFYKVWTGHAPELPAETLLVKAIKFSPPD